MRRLSISALTFLLAGVAALAGGRSSARTPEGGAGETTPDSGSPRVPEKRMSLRVVDDRLRPIEGVVSQVWNVDPASPAIVSVTDEHGQTPWVLFDGAQPTQITLADTVSPGGIALGKIELFPGYAMLDEGEDAHEWMHGRSMPFAVPVSVQGTNVSPEDGSYPHWQLALPPDSELNFSMHVAMLMDGEAVAEYLAYRGATASSSEYVRGLVLVMPSVQTGAGFLAAVRLHGDLDDGTGATVDLFNFHQKAKTLPVGPALAVEGAEVEGDWVAALVQGTIRKGHLAILVRSPAAGPPRVVQQVDAPPEILIPAGGAELGDPIVLGPQSGNVASEAALLGAAGGVVALGGAMPDQDCDPEAPEPAAGWTCEPPAPTDCPATPVGDKECSITKWKSKAWCRTPGSGVGRKRLIRQSYKVTFGAKGGNDALSTQGGFEYGREEQEEQTDGWTAEQGAHGRGQCMRYYYFYLDCGQKWSTESDQWHITFLEFFPLFYRDPCSVPRFVWTVCSDETDSQAVCDRLP